MASTSRSTVSQLRYRWNSETIVIYAIARIFLGNILLGNRESIKKEDYGVRVHFADTGDFSNSGYFTVAG